MKTAWQRYRTHLVRGIQLSHHIMGLITLCLLLGLFLSGCTAAQYTSPGEDRSAFDPFKTPHNQQLSLEAPQSEIIKAEQLDADGVLRVSDENGESYEVIGEYTLPGIEMPGYSMAYLFFPQDKLQVIYYRFVNSGDQDGFLETAQEQLRVFCTEQYGAPASESDANGGNRDYWQFKLSDGHYAKIYFVCDAYQIRQENITLVYSVSSHRQ